MLRKDFSLIKNITKGMRKSTQRRYMDYIIRATAAGGQIRAFAADTTTMVEEGKSIHGTSPVATAALGRLMTAATMMGSMMKGEKDILTLKVNCSGPIGGITVTSDSKANVKGLVNNPQVMLPPNKLGKLDVAGAVDLGVLSVIMDLGMKEPYVSQVNMVSGEIAEDITYYYATSEQVPSSVALGVLMNKDNTVRKAGGFIIQLMPFTSDEVIDALEAKINSLEPVTTMLDKGMSPEDILTLVLGEFGIEFNDKMPTAYNCNCSSERFEKGIISIGKKDILDMINDEKPIEVKCQFCGKTYTYSVEQLKEMYEKAK